MGFKGSWLSLWFYLSGAKVMGLSNEILTKPSHFRSLKLNNKIISKNVNICDLKKNEKNFFRFQTRFCFSFSCSSLVKKSYISPIETYQSNTLGTFKYFRMFKKLEK